MNTPGAPGWAYSTIYIHLNEKAGGGQNFVTSGGIPGSVTAGLNLLSSTMQTANREGRARGWGLGALAFAAALAIGSGGPARAADQIEDTLPAQAYKVVKYLKQNGYQNVGVLKFRVQKGNERSDKPCQYRGRSVS